MYLENGLDIVLVRTLDVNDLPECERLEALKMVTQLLVLFRQQKADDDVPPVPTTFPGNVLTVLTAIAMQSLPTFDESKDDSVPNDGIGLAALAILLELSVSNPVLVIETVGTEWLLRSLIGPGANNCRYTALSCHVLTKWLDCAEIRERAELNLFLEQMLAPLVDIGFFQGPSKESQLIRNEAFEMSANVFLNLLRTWAGLFSCAANDDGANGRTSSPLMLLEYLGLGRVVNANMLKVRDMIVDICCEFLDMPYATRKFSSWPEVKLFYAEMHLPDAYKCSLRDNFVVGEVNTYTASEQTCHGEVDLLRSFRALATFILVSTGLPQGLARLIMIKPDDPMSLKATLLLSDLLRTGSMFLPSDWRMRIVSAPTLVQSATETFFGDHTAESEVCSNGGGGVSDKGNALLLLHRLDRLSEIWQSRADITTQLHNINLFVLSGRPPSPPKEFDEKREQLEHHLVSALEKSFSTDDKMPDWLHVQTALQCFEADPGLLEKVKHSDKCHSFFSRATPLAESEPHYAEMVEKFIADFCRQLDPSNVYRGTFAPKNLLNTLAMYYFAFINAISASKIGYEMLEKSGIYQV
ncbi:Protein RICT-1 b [Aphelenchoides avenae]|nr:Protein RICT-1 b [Aphelenchus avenae]